MLQNKAYSLRNKDALHEVRLCLETNAHLSNEIVSEYLYFVKIPKDNLLWFPIYMLIWRDYVSVY